MEQVTLDESNKLMLEIFIRLAVEVAVLFIIIAGIYRKYSGKKELMFTFFLMGMVIFTICAVLKKVEINMGIAFGLFAIFSIIRFRTANYTAKDMAYLFTVIGLSAINAMFNFPNPVRGTIIFNSIIILTVFILEISLKGNIEEASAKKEKKKKKKEKQGKKKQPKETILLIYNNTELLSDDRKDELIKDISEKTGKKPEKVTIRKIDLIKGYAEIEVSWKKKTESPEK